MLCEGDLVFLCNCPVTLGSLRLWVHGRTPGIPRNVSKLQLICLNGCFFLVTQSPRKNVLHLGFVFLAVLALRSGDYIETCDIYREKHSCRCYVLSELHKTTSVLRRLFDASDATTQSRDLKHTKCHHLDPKRSITKWESMCSRSLTQAACASQS